MDLTTLTTIMLFLVPGVSGCGRGSIHIKDNEYRDMLIAIEPSTAENVTLLYRLMEIFTNASEYLYKVTRQRAYFGEITILVPKSWSDQPSYEPRTKEAVDKSDILIDQPDERFNHGNRPFVIKTTACGELGHYMHLTPTYVLNDTVARVYGPYDKTIIHEWAHLRYGVYDEYPVEGSSQHFYAADNGDIEGVRCSAAIQGRFYDIVRQTESCNFENGLPDKDCRFHPGTKETEEEYSSLMYSQKLHHIVHFCDNDETSPLTLHNRQARNKHNQMCDGKSVWEVMRAHGDFENDFNPPRNVSSTTPRFRLVKESTRSTVLVLDISGSMREFDRISRLARAVSNYIARVVADGERLGIVWFSGKASIQSQLVVVNNQTRLDLLTHVPTQASGATSIGDGILKGLQVLSSSVGGTMVLLSDGFENTAPWVRDVQQQVIDANVVVDTVAVSAAADAQLEMLAQTTGGLSFYFSDSDNSNALNEAFIASSEQGKSQRQRSIQLLSESFLLDPGQARRDVIYFDSSIGVSTDITIGYNTTTPDVVMVTPGGRLVDSSSPEYTHDSIFNTTNIYFADLNEVGGLRLNITNTLSVIQSISLTINSKIRYGQRSPIIAHAQWGSPSLVYPAIQTLYVSVSQGLSPILHAKVKAVLEQPGQNEGEATAVELTPRDNGAGSDVTKDDGVYSTYVCNFTFNGRYNVRVNVNDDSVTVVAPDRVVGMGAAVGYIGKEAPQTRSSVEHFQRFSSAGSFSLTEFVPGVDGYPPSKITDLQVTRVGHRQITLEWTAPGDDLDTGTAQHYELWMSTVFESVYANHTSTTPVTEDMLEEGSLQRPGEAGTTEYLVVNVNQHGDVTFYFVLVAVDDVANRSPRSNIVSASMKHVPVPNDINLGLIIGVAVAVTVVIIVTTGIAVLVYRQRKRGFFCTIRRKYKE